MNLNDTTSMARIGNTSYLDRPPEEVGEIAGHEQLAVLGLAHRTCSPEEAFIALTGVQS